MLFKSKKIEPVFEVNAGSPHKKKENQLSIPVNFNE